MIITAYFSEDGSPKTGLSPTLDIIDLSDNSVVVNDGAMSEVGQGWYKYTFAGYNSTKDYAILCDSVALTGSERYAVGSITDTTQLALSVADQVLEEIVSEHDSVVGSLAAKIKAILAKIGFIAKEF
jgi:hypothetical protein